VHHQFSIFRREHAPQDAHLYATLGARKPARQRVQIAGQSLVNIRDHIHIRLHGRCGQHYAGRKWAEMAKVITAEEDVVCEEYCFHYNTVSTRRAENAMLGRRVTARKKSGPGGIYVAQF
jgi:hypothetical protein